MIKSRFLGFARQALVALAALGPTALVHGEASSEVRIVAGRIDSGGGAVESGALRPGVFYDVVGAKEARLEGPAGASFRALPGTRFLVVDADAGHVAIRVTSGVIADAKGAEGMIDVATPAGTLRGDHATVYARVLPRGVYVEHQAPSTGTAGLFTPGAPLVTLAPGTFRMMALGEGDAEALSRAMSAPAAAPPAPAASAPTRAASGSAPALLGPVAARANGPSESAPPYDPSCGPNPCADPCPPPPCLPAPRCGGCGEYIRHSGVAVPARAPETGRSPLGSVLGDCACSPDPFCACHCGKIPYVHYVEGLECDVSTYRVGNCLVTVRPASRVRVTRLPDGSLQMWGPNLGKDLALIEVGDNQFGYIGDDGFLVVGCNCQFQYFRGLVHLYPAPGPLWPWVNPPRRREEPPTPTDVLPVVAPARAAETSAKGSAR